MAIIYDPKHLTYLEALRNLATQGKLSYRSFSDDWIVKFWNSNRVHFMLSRVPDVNTQVASDIATDKVGTHLLLADAGLAAVPHILLSTAASPDVDRTLIESLFMQHGELVIKPTTGSRGQDIARCPDVASAERHLAMHQVSSWSASPFIDIRSEVRLVVYDGAVRLAYEKCDPPVINGLKMFNLSLGATAQDIVVSTLDPNMRNLAIRAMQAISLKLGAVDVIFTADGTMQVLEINSSFSIEHYAGTNDEYRRKAVAFYTQLLESTLG